MAKAKKQKLNESLKGLDLSGSILQGRDFSNHDLTGTNFSGSEIIDCVFNGSNLFDADFRYSEIQRGGFFRTRLVECNLYETCFKNCEFNEVIVDAEDLCCTRFDGVKLKKCEFNLLNIFDSSFIKSEFEDCFFSRPFSYSLLSKTNFKSCSFQLWNPVDPDDGLFVEENLLVLQSSGDFPVFQVPAFGKHFPGETFYITTKGIFVQGLDCALAIDDWLKEAARCFGKNWGLAAEEWNLAVQLVRAHALANQ